MADMTMPRIMRLTAVAGLLTLFTPLSVAFAPLAQAAAGDVVPEYHQSGHANAPRPEQDASSLAMGEATNSVDLAADIARAAASGALNNTFDPRPDPSGIVRIQLSAKDTFSVSE